MFASLATQYLSGWDFLIAGLIVLFVEYCVKPLLTKVPEKTYNIVIKIVPVVIGAVVYLAAALITKETTWHNGLMHGLVVGLTSMGMYELILKTIKEAGMQGLTQTNEALKEAIENVHPDKK